MIHVIFISIVVGIAAKWLYDKATKKPEAHTEPEREEPVKDTPEETPVPVACDPDEIISLLGAEVKEKEGKGTLVLYQGGYFWIYFSDDVKWMDIAYSNFAQYKVEHANRVLMAANHTNDDLVGWKAVIRTADPDGMEEEPLSACLSYRLSLTGTSAEIAERVKTMFQQAFMVARYFSDKVSEIIKEADDMDEYTILDMAFRQKVNRAIRLVDLGHKEELGEEIPEKCDTAMLFNLFNDSELGCLQRMTIVCGECLEVCKELSRITDFDIREYIRSKANPADVKDLTLLIEFEQQNVMVHLRQEDCSTDKSLFYRMTVTRSGTDADHLHICQSSDCFRTLMEVRLEGAESDYWEAKFMIDDAMDKVDAGRESELSDEQRLLLSVSGNTARSDLYWATRYYNKGCYFQSLFHFNRVFHYIASHWGQLDEKTRELYFEVCLYIGFIYMELNMKDRAFYYLFHARSTNSLSAIREFTNCICNMNDPGTIAYIKSTLNNVLEELNKQDDEEQVDESLMSFYRFLNRRLAYSLIEANELEEAETLLNKMVAGGEDVEFAKEELAFIRRRKEEMKKNESK